MKQSTPEGMKRLGYILMAAYAPPKRWQCDDGKQFKTIALAKSYYNKHNACQSCLDTEVYRHHHEQGWIKIEPIYIWKGSKNG